MCYLLLSGDDDDDDEEDTAKKEEREKKRQEEEESLFHRLEESRLMLEQELGFDRFLKVYKYLQVRKQVKYSARLCSESPATNTPLVSDRLASSRLHMRRRKSHRHRGAMESRGDFPPDWIPTKTDFEKV